MCGLIKLFLISMGWHGIRVSILKDCRIKGQYLKFHKSWKMVSYLKNMYVRPIAWIWD